MGEIIRFILASWLQALGSENSETDAALNQDDDYSENSGIFLNGVELDSDGAPNGNLNSNFPGVVNPGIDPYSNET